MNAWLTFVCCLSLGFFIGCGGGDDDGDSSSSASSDPSTTVSSDDPVADDALEPPEASGGLEDRTWTLKRVDGTGISIPLTLRFTSGRVTGNGPCNILSGKYSTSGSTLRFSELGMTERACDDVVLNRLEQEVTQKLGAGGSYEVDGNRLRLGAEGHTLEFQSE